MSLNIQIGERHFVVFSIEALHSRVDHHISILHYTIMFRLEGFSIIFIRTAVIWAVVVW
jgi:hypothetical protein